MDATRRAALAAGLAASFAARAGHAQDAGRPIRVGVTSGVHAQVLERVRDLLQPSGLAMKVVEFSDLMQPNAALAAGDLEANAYQQQPFLEQQAKDRGYKLVPVGRTVMTAMALFSRKTRSPAGLQDGARVGIPKDPAEGGRALALLQDAGLITLREGGDFRSTMADIAENPRKLQIVQLDAPGIARALDSVDAAALAGSDAVAAGMDPLRDGLAVERPDSALIRQYCSLLVVRQGDEAKPWAKQLAAGYANLGLKEWMKVAYRGAVVPGA